MSRKTLFRLVFLGILALFAWTCNVSDSKPDTLTLHLADSLLKKYNKYDSIRIDVFVVDKLDSTDTLYRHVAFHGPYLDSSQLVNMNIGKLPSHDFVVVLIAYRAGVPALILGFPFSDGKVGKTDTLKPDNPHVNHPPLISFAAPNTGLTTFRIREGKTLNLVVVARDSLDAGDSVRLLRLSNLPTTCGMASYDTVTGVFSLKPSFACVDSATQKILPDVVFMARDSGGLTAQITAQITVEDSVRPVDVVITSPPNGFVTRDTVISVQWKVNEVVQNAQTSDTLRQEGPNGIKRSFQDSLGGFASDSITVYRDRTPPGKPLVTSPGLTNNPKPKWTWRSGGNGFGYFRFKLDTANLDSDTVGLTDTSFVPATNLSDGNHKLFVQERDVAGNWSPMDSTGLARIDITAPVVTIQSPTDSFVTNQGSVQVSWRVDGSNQTPVAKSLSEGVNTLTQSATDSAGNTGSASITATRRSNVLFVNAAQTDTAADGNSWTKAYKYLQKTLARATSGQEIWVARGIYKPAQGLSVVDTNTFDTSFVMKSGVGILGGFAGSENSKSQRDWMLNESIFSGDRGDTSITDNLGPVLLGANNATVDGIVVERGYLKDQGFNFNVAPGMLNSQVSPQIMNCLFRENKNASYYSAGAICNKSSAPIIQGCRFIGNKSMGVAGAMLNYDASPTVTRCVFEMNETSLEGGAIRNFSSSSPLFASCSFINNRANFGGAVMDNGNSTYLNSLFLGNTANGGGAINLAVAGVFINGCVFSSNTATNGGAIYTQFSFRMMNSTLCLNAADERGGGIFIDRGDSNQSFEATNCVLSGNTAKYSPGGPQIAIDVDSLASDTIAVRYSILQGGTSAILMAGTIVVDEGPGISSLNPLFKNTANVAGPDGKYFTSDDGLSLSVGSPAINSGDPDATGTPATDITGAPRIQSGRIDMGAYEQ